VTTPLPPDDEPFGFLPEGDDTPTEPAPVAIERGHIPHRYRRSAGASMLAAGLIGLREVIDPPKDDRPVVEQFADEDDIDRPIEVFLDPDDPAASLVVIRDPADSN
jgi:hypothetical protein